MDDDIVARLRGPYEWQSVAIRYGEGFYDETPFEAAAEIDRLRGERDAMHEALRHANRTLAAAFDRIHCLPRTADTSLAAQIGKTLALICATLSLTQEPRQ